MSTTPPTTPPPWSSVGFVGDHHHHPPNHAQEAVHPSTTTTTTTTLSQRPNDNPLSTSQIIHNRTASPVKLGPRRLSPTKKTAAFARTHAEPVPLPLKRTLSDTGLLRQGGHLHAPPHLGRTMDIPPLSSQQQQPPPPPSSQPSDASGTSSAADSEHPKHALEPFDWAGFEARCEDARRGFREREEGIWAEFGGLVDFFGIWASTLSTHEDERSRKRLKTRTHWVQTSEQTFNEKRAHYIKVVAAFKSALELLGRD